MQLIGKVAVPIVIVHDSVLSMKAPLEILPALVRDYTELIYLPAQPIVIDAQTNFSMLRDSFSHSADLRGIERFVEAAGCKSIAMAADFADGMCSVPSEVALLTLRMSCTVRDIVVFGSMVHVKLLTPIACELNIAEPELFNEMPFILHFLAECLGNLDEDAMSPTAMLAESMSFPLKPMPALVRQWRQLMAMFNKSALDALLAQFVHVLEAATDRCRQATPAWEACFPNGVMQLSMLERMLSGKFASIVKGHDHLHTTLKKMSDAGRLLQVTPKLQDNDATSQSIAIALNSMSAASIAATVAMGLDVLNFASHPSGGQKAADFLDKYRHAKGSDIIPKSFWNEIENLGSLAPAAQGAKSSKASVRSAPASHSQATAPSTPIAPKPRPLMAVKTSPGAGQSSRSSTVRLAPAPSLAPSSAASSSGAPSMKRIRKS